MTLCSIELLADHVVLRRMAEAFSDARTREADGIAFLAIVDARKLYAPAGHASTLGYCVHEMHMSDDVAFRRIRVARLIRQFPVIQEHLTDGRLHLTAVLLLSPYLTEANAAELLAAATHKTKAEIELLIAQRFPQPDLATLIRPVSPAPSPISLAAPSLAANGAVDSTCSAIAVSCQLAPARVGMTTPGHSPQPPAPAPSPRARVAPLAPERFALQVTIAQETHDKLRYAQALLGHALPSGDVAQVLDRALDALIEQLERRKFGAGARTRSGKRRGKSGTRHVPAAVRREVWQRDGGRCTFVSEQGHRCEARTRLELDHIQPVARGGETTADNLRLTCRTHNQHAAERVFGAGFMDRKPRETRSCEATPRDASEEREATLEREHAAAAAEGERNADVIPWLRRLGFRKDEARRGAASCAALAGAPLDERVRHALRSLAPRCKRVGAPAGGASTGLARGSAPEPQAHRLPRAFVR